MKIFFFNIKYSIYKLSINSKDILSYNFTKINQIIILKILFFNK